MDAKFTELVEQLNGLDFKGMYGSDFLHTWDKTTDELKALYIVADALRELRENNVSSKIFDSGLAVSLFRDNSTRTRFSFSKAANLLGLELQDLDEKKSQIAHGETVRETATMISFMADVIGIRDDMYIGKGDAYMAEVSESVQQAYEDGVLDHRPTLISLQSDSDHPTQSSADMLYLINEFGGLENLKGKKVAVTWAYSPSYGKPLSCPQSLISLLPRFGMDVTLAHPEGYDLMPEVVERARGYAAESGTTFKQVNTMAEAFEGSVCRHGEAHQPVRRGRRRRHRSAREGAARPERHPSGLVLHDRAHGEDRQRPGHHLYAPAARRHLRCLLRARRGQRRRLRHAPRGHVQGGQLQAVRHRSHDVPAEGCRSRRYPQGPRRAQHRPLVPGLKLG